MKNFKTNAKARPCTYGQQLCEQTRKAFKERALTWFLALFPMMASDSLKWMLSVLPQSFLWINPNVTAFVIMLFVELLVFVSWVYTNRKHIKENKLEKTISELLVGISGVFLELSTSTIAGFVPAFSDIVYVATNFIISAIVVLVYMHCFEGVDKKERKEARREWLAFVVGVVVLDYMCGRWAASYALSLQCQILHTLITLLIKFAIMFGLLALVIFLGKVLTEVGLQIRIRKSLLKKAKKENWKVKCQIVLLGSKSKFAINYLNAKKRSKKKHKKKRK